MVIRLVNNATYPRPGASSSKLVPLLAMLDRVGRHCYADRKTEIYVDRENFYL